MLLNSDSNLESNPEQTTSGRQPNTALPQSATRLPSSVRLSDGKIYVVRWPFIPRYNTKCRGITSYLRATPPNTMEIIQ